MAQTREIVITGMGVVSPIGIGNAAFWTSLSHGCSGVRRLELFHGMDIPPVIGASVADFDPKRYVRPRKSLKVMSRDIQLAFAAADFACKQASFDTSPVDPDRLGIVFGTDMIACDLYELVNAFKGCIVDGRFDFDRWGHQAMTEMYPLWMLKYLPNMPACHIGIAHGARGPNNSITLSEVSSLSAVAEAMRVIERGQADAMIAGGTSSRIHPAIWAYRQTCELSQRSDDPAAASRPFDAQRDGMVHGEGAGTFILEERRHAEARGATVLARILGFAATFEPSSNNRPPRGDALRNGISLALKNAGLKPDDIGHVNANGLSTALDDRIEARGIHDVLGDVPVTAPKSYFGNLGACTGVVEMAVSILAFKHGLVPPTLNYEHPDPECPVNVIHQTAFKPEKPNALMLNQTQTGQSIAMVLAAP